MELIYILLFFSVDFPTVMLAIGKPDPPKDIRIHVNGSKAEITWIIPTNQGVKWSRVYLMDSKGGDIDLTSERRFKDVDYPTSSFEIPNLSMCSEYTVKINCLTASPYSEYTTQKFWMTNTTVTADINENVSLIWRTSFNNDNSFTVQQNNRSNIIYTAHFGTISVNSKTNNYKFDNMTKDISRINITVISVRKTDAGLYRTVDDNYAVDGCCLLVVTDKPTNPTLTVSPEPPFVGDSITLKCHSMVQRWPMYMPSNLSYRFFGASRGSAENNRFMINNITTLDKGTSVSCQATDDREKLSNMSKTVTLDPYYGPDNVVLKPGHTSLNVTEGFTLGPINCNATCYPKCSFKWRLNKTRTFEDFLLNETLVVANITKNQSGSYRCVVFHSNDTTRMKRTDVSVNVQYSPKITTFWIDRRVNPSTHSFNENVRPQIKLRIESNPDPRLELTSTFLKVLLLNYTKDSRGYLATQLPSLKCEESGMFTIQARNGIAYGDNKTVNLTILCKPRVVKIFRTIGAKINTDVNIKMDVVAFPAPTVRWRRMTTFKWTVRRGKHDYRYDINSTIQISSEDGFGEHEIDLCNTVDCIVEKITFKPEDRPEAPQNVSSETTFRSVNLSWIAGFNGGHRQNFSVQFKTADDDNWDTRIVPTSDTGTGSKVYYTLDLLKPDTLYQVMVLSTNKHGERNASLEFKTEVEPTLPSPSSASVSPLSIGIGCGIAVLLLTIILLVFIIRRKKSSNTESKECNVLYAEVDKEQHKGKQRKQVKEDSDEPANAEYASVVKSKSKKVHYKEDAIETENNEYAVVDKSNKENEGVYANQDDEELIPHKPLEAQISGRSTNQDGLTYIEVSFTSNQSDRRPIIGAESKTDYVDIDFTRKADPLPDDSD
ncbi:protein turtle homolog B-like [Mytilus edulis]|uniref:protein turtle homolog B-like n=1 Tax=Mytilus edulis TaxID=6550 RepID=UPI0039F04AED